MAITYTWKIDMMHTQSKLGMQDAVTEVHWSKTGTDETGATGRYPGCTKFRLIDIGAKRAAGQFVPLENITEEQVIEWVKSEITEDDMIFIDTQIQASIDHQKAPKTAASIDPKDFPWATS